jgi:hypothetical protein
MNLLRAYPRRPLGSCGAETGDSNSGAIDGDGGDGGDVTVLHVSVSHYENVVV